jgi:hypothetical protein
VPLVADSGRPHITVRVPAALMLARGLDTLTVSVDPASLAPVELNAEPGMTLGVATDVVVFVQGQAAPDHGRRGLSSGVGFAQDTDTWSAAQDGLPVPGRKYEAEMRLTLFETDVPPGSHWNPEAGRYEVLWARTLRQAEE